MGQFSSDQEIAAEWKGGQADAPIDAHFSAAQWTRGPRFRGRTLWQGKRVRLGVGRAPATGRGTKAEERGSMGENGPWCQILLKSIVGISRQRGSGRRRRRRRRWRGDGSTRGAVKVQCKVIKWCNSTGVNCKIRQAPIPFLRHLILAPPAHGTGGCALVGLVPCHGANASQHEPALALARSLCHKPKKKVPPLGRQASQSSQRTSSRDSILQCDFATRPRHSATGDNTRNGLASPHPCRLFML